MYLCLHQNVGVQKLTMKNIIFFKNDQKMKLVTSKITILGIFWSIFRYFFGLFFSKSDFGPKSFRKHAKMFFTVSPGLKDQFNVFYDHF